MFNGNICKEPVASGNHHGDAMLRRIRWTTCDEPLCPPHLPLKYIKMLVALYLCYLFSVYELISYSSQPFRPKDTFGIISSERQCEMAFLQCDLAVYGKLPTSCVMDYCRHHRRAIETPNQCHAAFNKNIQPSIPTGIIRVTFTEASEGFRSSADNANQSSVLHLTVGKGEFF